MDFTVYLGAREATVLVPRLFQIPESAYAHLPLTPVGSVEVVLEELSHSAVEQLGLYGFAVLGGAEAATLLARAELTDPAIGKILPAGAEASD